MAEKCPNKGCNESFKFQMQLARHLSKCTKEAPPAVEKQPVFRKVDGKFVCLVCEFPFTDKSNLYKHIRKGRCKGNLTVSSVDSCSVDCLSVDSHSHLDPPPTSSNALSPSSSSFAVSVQLLDPQQKVQNASSRSRSSSASSLKAMKNAEYSRSRSSSPSRSKFKNNVEYMCSVCSKVFPYPSKLRDHMKTHERTLEYCAKCGKEFKRKDHKEKHFVNCSGNFCSSNISMAFDGSAPPRVEDEQLHFASSPEVVGANIHASNFVGEERIDDMDTGYNGVEVVDITEHVLFPVGGGQIDTVDSAHSFHGDIQVVDVTENDSSIRMDNEFQRDFVVYCTDDNREPVGITTFHQETNQIPPYRDDENKENKAPQSDQMRKRKSRGKQCIKNLSAIVGDRAARKELLEKALLSQDEYSSPESKCSIGLSNFLKKIKKESRRKMYANVTEMFGVELEDRQFRQWLATNLDIKFYRFEKEWLNWKKFNFEESRGRKGISIELKQRIHNEWIDSSIPTVDCRNGRGIVRIRKSKYEENFEGIKHDPPLQGKRNKRNVLQYEATRRIKTCTVREIKKKFEEEYQINISLGIIQTYKPFYVGNATEKERVMCMCMCCLNTSLLFKALCKDRNDYESPSKFYMHNCPCQKHENGYWQLDCVRGKCQDCAGFSVPDLEKPAEMNDDKISYYMYEVTKTPYISKKDRKEKISTKTERVSREESFESVLQKFKNQKDLYTHHRYQVCNDKLVWKSILETTNQHRPILHCDYSENISGTPKYEPQSAHFNKAQFSLHCCVVHEDDEDKPYSYYYHFCNDNTHDYAFTGTVVDDVLEKQELSNFELIRLKTDNCAGQYKCKKVFPYYQSLSKRVNKTVICYYGVSGLGKGLVDAMSGFGVKEPIRKAIIQKDFYFNTSSHMIDYLQEKMQLKDNLHYSEIPAETLVKRRETCPIKKIVGVLKQHMISYFPNGEVQIKEQICGCENCIVGEFVKCSNEFGKIVINRDESLDMESDDDDLLDEIEEEEFEMPIELVFDEIKAGNTISLYSDRNSHEPFYLCQVVDVNVAEANEKDGYGHWVQKDEKFITAHYYENVRESKKEQIVQYKLLTKKKVFVMPGCVFHMSVPMTKDHKLSLSEYQFLCDCV